MNSKDPKQFWKLTNKVLRKSKDSTIGPIITDSKDVLTSDLEKASYFNEFFINISEELTKNLEPLDPKTLTSYVTRVTPTRCDIELNWELVKKKIEKSSKPNKATGPDLVSPKDLKLLGVSSIHSLLPIFKKSIDDTVFPTNWKLSRVKPVLKKGAPTDMSNFRPISLLSIPGKILEDIISDSIDNHIEAQDLLSDNQWGFRKNHSTEGLLLHLTDTWKWALDENLKVGVLFTDFRKALNSVNHTILLQKLKAAGISGNLLSWMKSYLSNRNQFVQVNEVKSDTSFIKFGVPQGSILDLNCSLFMSMTFLNL